MMFGQFNHCLRITSSSILSIAGIIYGTIGFQSTIAVAQTGLKLTESDRASTQSLGPVKIGMTISAANTAAKLQFVQMGSGSGSQCQYYQPGKQIKGIVLMVTNGVISRVDITNPRIKTLSGIKVGDTEQQVTNIYGSKIKVKQHHYNSKGHYLIYVPQEPQAQKHQIVFETDGQRVVNWRFGKVEEVNWIEGCS